MESSTARRALAAALIAGVVGEILFDRSALGVSVPLATAAVLALVTWFAPRRRPADPLDAWLPVMALVASLGPAIRTDPSIVALDVLLVAMAVSAWAFAVSGVPVTRQSAAAIGWLGARAGAATGAGLLWLVARSGADGSITAAATNVRRLAPLARGLVIAVPVLAVFSLLLTSADAVFGRALDEALRLPFDIDMVAHRGSFALVAAVVVGGPLAIALGISRAAGWPLLLTPEPAKEPRPESTTPQAPRSGAVEVLVVVVAVDVLFALFAAVQVAFLFGGRDTLAVVGLTYSDYARQGYFQLAGVVALAGLLLIGAHAVVGRTRTFLAAAIVLLLLTAVILASAAFRLGLYQGAYGWTELRFYVAASIAWLTICVAMALALLSANRMRWLPHGLAVGAVAVTLVVSALGPQEYVMRQNLARALDPRLVAEGGQAGLDVGYGSTLGDDAIPDLVIALAVVPEPDRAALLFRLRLRRDELAEQARTEGPLSWNLARTRARAALAQLPAD